MSSVNKGNANATVNGNANATTKANAVEEQKEDFESVPMRQFEAFTSLTSMIATQTDALEVAMAIKDKSSSVLNCDRTSFFFVDGDMLDLVIAKGVNSIKLPKSKGLAGKCATTGELVNVADAHLDAIFDSSWDVKNNFRTKQVLCVPIKDDNGNVIGVLQAINTKNDLKFDSVSEKLFTSLATQVSVAIRSAIQLQAAQQAKRQKDSLISYIKNMNTNTNASSLLFTLNKAAQELLEADRCTFYTVNHHEKKLHLINTDAAIDITLNLNQGIAGAVATTAETVNIPDCYKDSRFDSSFDKKTGYKTCSMLVMPVWAGLEEQTKSEPPIAVVQLINKNKGDAAFDDDDVELLQILLRFVGPLIKFSRLFDHHRKKDTEVEMAKDLKPKMYRYPSKENLGGLQSPQATNTIMEGTEPLPEDQETDAINTISAISNDRDDQKSDN